MTAEGPVTEATVDLTEPARLEAYLNHPIGTATRIGVDRRPNWMRDLIRRGEPVVIEGFAAEWPALQRWSLGFWSELGKGQQATVERGNTLQGPVEFDLRDIGDYVRDDLPQAHDKSAVPYLLLANFLNRFPELAADIDFGEFKRHLVFSSLFCWIGPRHYVTGFHYDRLDTLFVQILGVKEFVFASPVERHRMYPSSKYDPFSQLSSIDLEAFKQAELPLFREVSLSRATVTPGDAVYIPPGWWHHVVSKEMSISVSCFGPRPSGLPLAAFEWGKSVLYRYVPPFRTRQSTLRSASGEARPTSEWFN